MRNIPIASYIRDQVETLPREEIAALQLERLRAGVDRISRSVPFYHQKLAEAGISANEIRSLEDLSRLPFTTKADLRDNYPFGMLAVPKKEVIRIHASSGTTGKPTVVAYTRNDLDLWSELMARSMAAGGVTADVCSTPLIAEVVQEEGVDLRSLPLRVLRTMRAMLIGHVS